jgi:acyl carrier protein
VPRPVVEAPAAAQSAPASTGSLSGANLEKFLINFVVEQTGYPEEMVELDADLEADLGIDSIKKAQLFGELSEYFEVQVSEDLTLDDFPTLRHVVNFLEGSPRKPGP